MPPKAQGENRQGENRRPVGLRQQEWSKSNPGGSITFPRYAADSGAVSTLGLSVGDPEPMGRLETTLQAQFPKGFALSDEYQARVRLLEERLPAFSEQLATRLESAAGDKRRVSDILGDLIAVSDGLGKGATVFPEPAIDSDRQLALRDPQPGEKRSDAAINLPGADRPLNVEVKTPTPDDDKDPTPYGKYERDFDARIKRRRAAGLNPRTVGIVFDPSILKHDGDEMGAAMKLLEEEASRLVNSASKAPDFKETSVLFKGERIARLHLGPGENAVAHGKGMGAPPFNAKSILDRGQYADGVPNVVLVNRSGELLPLPDLILAACDELMQGNATKRNYRRISGVLLYQDNQNRTLLENPNAEVPLNSQEKQFLMAPFPAK